MGTTTYSLSEITLTKFSTPDGDEHLSDDIEQLFELTRIMVLVLTGLVPSLDDSKSAARHALSEEAVALLTTALSALVDAAHVFPSIIKTDLHACILHIFAAILASPSCQSSVIPQSLPLLKRFVSSITATSDPQSDTSAQLRATLLRFLQTLKRAQNRDFDAALACEKNAILTITILLSSGASAFAPADPLIERFIAELADCLGNRMTSKVAATCVRSLLLLPKRSPLEIHLAAHLLPRILAFLTQPSSLEGLEESRSTLAAALVAFLGGLQTEAQRVTGAKVVVPALLARVRWEGEGVKGETARLLMEVAGRDQAAFRKVVGGLGPREREEVQGVLKAGQGGRREEGEGEEGPRIALRMDFG